MHEGPIVMLTDAEKQAMQQRRQEIAAQKQQATKNTEPSSEETAKNAAKNVANEAAMKALARQLRMATPRYKGNKALATEELQNPAHMDTYNLELFRKLVAANVF